MSSRARTIAARLWTATVITARYLGPLLRDVTVYVWHLALDAIGGLRLLILHWQRRRTPARASDCTARQAAIRDERTRRWTRWQSTSRLRRHEVRAATVILVILLIAVARYSREGTSATEPAAVPSSTTTSGVADPVAASLAAAEAAKSEEIKKRIARFGAQRQRSRQGEWAALRDIPGLERGRLGDWDGYSVSLPVVLKDDDGRRRYRMWFRGCHLAMHEFSCGIGHATSVDGIAWEKSPERVFAPEDPTIQESLDEIAIVKAGGRYYLWFSVMANHLHGRRRATVHLATSPDGLAWTDEGQVLESPSETTTMIAHAALHDGERFHLWYLLQPDRSSSPVLQHLSSSDGKAWTDDGGTSIQDALNMSRLSRLTVARAGSGFRAYAYDSGLHALTSPDGTTWTKDASAAGRFVEWEADRVEVHSLTAVQDHEGLWIWMDIRPTQDDMRLGVAFRKGNQS